MCAALLPALLALLAAFIVLWLWVGSPLLPMDERFDPAEAERATFRRRLAGVGPVLVVLAATLVAVVAVGALLACE